MYEQKLWQDHVTEFEDRYTESRNDDGTITHTPVEGEIIQQGTPQNATNFNHMENGISNATETAALMALSTIHHQQAIADLQGETATVALKNTQQYPFNNSTQSVALKTERNHTGAICRNLCEAFPCDLCIKRFSYGYCRFGWHDVCKFIGK